jgi:hypothetical protein
MPQRTTRVNPCRKAIKIWSAGIRFLVTGEVLTAVHPCLRFAWQRGRSWRLQCPLELECCYTREEFGE